MRGEEIRDRVIELLDIYFRLGAYLGQEPYKGDFFKLCREAHRWKHHRADRRVRLSADALYDSIVERWIPERDPDKLKAAETLRQMWREWLYALDHS